MTDKPGLRERLEEARVRTIFGGRGLASDTFVNLGARIALEWVREEAKALPSFEKETFGGWNSYDEMVEQEVKVSEHDGESWNAGEWVRRDDVLGLFSAIRELQDKGEDS